MESLELFLPHPFFFLFLLLSDGKLFISDLPELTELLLLSEVHFLLEPPLLHLELPTPLNVFLGLQLLPFLLLKEPSGLLFSLIHLLVQNLFLPILHIRQVLDLLVYYLLPRELLLLELLIFLVPPKLLQGISLLRVFFNLLLIFDLFLLFNLSVLDQFLITLFEICSLVSLFHLPFDLPLLFSQQFFLDLSLDQFSLQLLFLDPFDVAHFEILELVLDDFGVHHFLFILFHEFVP
mmetsp:Transcript_15863/g.15276  ORF Transcript_15863/g.15276 Transcript_15863/m.15276 type:complete len:236 (-) Transcript_15863:605-1312(-)